MTMDELRARIDELDRKLVELLNERATCAVRIGHLKRDIGMAIYQPEREAEVLRNVQAQTSLAGGPLSPDAISRLFERIIDEGRRLERELMSEPDGHDRGSLNARQAEKRRSDRE
jgi:chorismate mutase